MISSHQIVLVASKPKSTIVFENEEGMVFFLCKVTFHSSHDLGFGGLFLWSGIICTLAVRNGRGAFGCGVHSFPIRLVLINDLRNELIFALRFISSGESNVYFLLFHFMYFSFFMNLVSGLLIVSKFIFA